MLVAQSCPTYIFELAVTILNLLFALSDDVSDSEIFSMHFSVQFAVCAFSHSLCFQRNFLTAPDAVLRRALAESDGDEGDISMTGLQMYTL